MNDRAILLVVLLLAGLPSSFAFAQDAEEPNIVLIVADDLGYGDLASFGADDMRTPHIDSLVQRGMRFSRFYANSPVCSPTRAALLTGRYPDKVGVPGVIRTHAANSWGYLAPDALLLPAVLRRAGYHTGMVGKWHLGLSAPNRPQDRGFDFFQGFLGDMMDDYFTHRRHGLNYMRRNDDVIDPGGHATDLFTDWAVRYLQERSQTAAPFFLYLAYNAPHSPVQPPDGWLEKVKTREEGISDERARLVALIEHMDDGIGDVVQTLRETGQYANTLIVFTSDNGGALYFGAENGELRGGKQDMYEGGLRIPMAAVWPGQIDPGTHSDRVALTMDLYPTLVEAAGIPLTHRIDGRSLIPTLHGEPVDGEERTLFFVRREGGKSYMGKTAWAVRRGPWKLVQNRPAEPFRLYNLRRDPLEENDVSVENEDVLGDLGHELRRHIQEAGAVPWQQLHR